MSYRKLSALVAGDSSATRIVTASLLMGLGVGDVRQANDGGEAFRSICALPPDFVLLDFDLERDAIATLMQIRRAPETPRRDLPVAIAAAFVTKSNVEALVGAGVSTIVLKPTTIQKLDVCVRSLINDPRKFINTAAYTGPDRRKVRPPGYAGPHRRIDDDPRYRVEIA